MAISCFLKSSSIALVLSSLQSSFAALLHKTKKPSILRALFFLCGNPPKWIKWDRGGGPLNFRWGCSQCRPFPFYKFIPIEKLAFFRYCKAGWVFWPYALHPPKTPHYGAILGNILNIETTRPSLQTENPPFETGDWRHWHCDAPWVLFCKKKNGV